MTWMRLASSAETGICGAAGGAEAGSGADPEEASSPPSRFAGSGSSRCVALVPESAGAIGARRTEVEPQSGQEIASAASRVS